MHSNAGRLSNSDSFFIERFIKMSSPNLNNSVLLGCFLSYLSVFLFGLDGAFISSGYEVICAVSGNHSLISGIILVPLALNVVLRWFEIPKTIKTLEF